MTSRALKQTQPTLSVRPRRRCDACQRWLPKRAHRKQCASCVKLAAGYRRMLKTQNGWRSWVRVWMSQAEYEAQPSFVREVR